MRQEFNDILEIQTPEQVHLGYEVAGIASRGVASLIDTIIQFIFLMIVNVFALRIMNALDDYDPQGTIAIVVFFLFYFILYWGYFVFFELLWNGQTPGKRMIGIRTLQVNGLPVGMTHSALRNLVRPIDFLFFYGLGMLSMFASQKSQRLGDFAGGTLVVHDKLVSLKGMRELAVIDNLPEILEEDRISDLPVHRLQPHDIHLAESYIARRQNMQGVRELARPIIENLYAKMDLEFPQKPIPYNEAISKMAWVIESYYTFKNR